MNSMLWALREVIRGAVKGVSRTIGSSGENSELIYHYNKDDGGCGGDRWRCREILGYAILDLTIKRQHDLYLRRILSGCTRVNLDGGAGELVYRQSFRALCARVLDGDEDAMRELAELPKRQNFSEKCINDALEIYKTLFAKGMRYGDFIRDVFVVSVGKSIEQFVLDDNGEAIRDGNGGYVKEVVGTDYSVARFKVTFSSGHRIGLKVYLSDGGSFEGLRPHQSI